VIPTEEQEQRALAEWLDWHGIRWFHPANGGARTKAEAGVFRAIGVKPGVPDVIIVDPPPAVQGPCGVAIELKRREGGRISDAQREWLARLRYRGWWAEVCAGADEAIELLERLGFGRREARR